MAKTDTLHYNFTTDDGTFVNAVAGGTISGGVCSMPYTSGSTVKQTAVNWDLTGSHVIIEVVALGTVTSDETYFCFGAPGGLFNASQAQIIIGYTGTANEYYLVPREINSSGGNVATEPFIDVVAADVRWLRFRHAGTTLFWETSPDGDTWTIRRQKTPVAGFPAAAGRIKMGAFNFTGNGVASAQFDNINPVTSEQHAATGALDQSYAIAGTAFKHGRAGAVIDLAAVVSGTGRKTARTVGMLDLALDSAPDASKASAAETALAEHLALAATGEPAKAATGSLATDLAVAAEAQKATSATGATDLALGVDGTGAKSANTSGDIGVLLEIAGSPEKHGQAAADLALALSIMAGAGPMPAQTAIPIQFGISATARKHTAAVTAIPLTLETTAGGQKQAVAAALLTLQNNLAGTATKESNALAELLLDLGLSGLAEEQAPTAELPLTLTLSGITRKTSKSDTGIALNTTVFATATKVGRATSTLTMSFGLSAIAGELPDIPDVLLLTAVGSPEALLAVDDRLTLVVLPEPFTLQPED